MQTINTTWKGGETRFSVDMTTACARAFDDWYRKMLNRFSRGTIEDNHIRELLALTFREGWMSREDGG